MISVSFYGLHRNVNHGFLALNHAIESWLMMNLLIYHPWMPVCWLYHMPSSEVTIC